MRTIKSKYINLQGEDSDTTGKPSLRTTAFTEVNIDFNGIEFKAKATCNASSPFGEEEECGGNYMVDAWVINTKGDFDPDEWEGSVIRKAEVDDFDWWDDGGIGEIEGEQAQKDAMYALLLSCTDANASVNGGPVDEENSNSGSCGSGSCGPGDDEWGQSVADGTF